MADYHTRIASPISPLRVSVAAAAYFLAHQAGYLLRVPPERDVAIWPATGVAVGVMLACRPHERFRYGCAMAVALLVSAYVRGTPIGLGLLYLSANVIEAVVAFAVIRSVARGAPIVGSVRGAVALVMAATLGNAATAVAGGLVNTFWWAEPFPALFLAWWASNGLGMLLVAPLVATVVRRVPLQSALTTSRPVEVVVFLATYTTAAWVVFHVGTPFAPLPYALLALLTWGSLRLGSGVVALALIVLAASASTSSLVGHGPSPLGGVDLQTRLLLLQAYLAVTAVMGLMLAASKEEADTAFADAQEESRRVTALADNLPGGAVFQLVAQEDGPRLAFASAGVAAMTGVEPDRLITDPAALFNLLDTQDKPGLAALLSSDGVASPIRDRLMLRREGHPERQVSLSLAARTTRQGVTIWDGILLDVTDEHVAQQALHDAELRFQEAQRAQLVGQLAGGVAHDFNNVLTIIVAATELLAMRRRPDDEQEILRQILGAAQRASALTHQLLAMGRRTMLAPVPMWLEDVVHRSEALIRGTVGEAIEVVIHHGAHNVSVCVDPVQIERVLLNLVLNAKDAMPDGGTLSIETGSGPLSTERAPVHGTPPEHWAWLAISDTGVGMSDETRARLFEPFFTTKRVGHSAGLGLAAAEGVVRQSHGFIEVESASGAGSTFRVFLPEHLGAPPPPPAVAPPVAGGTAVETILLIEDEDAVRRIVSRALRTSGYRVLEAASGPAALAMPPEEMGAVQLIVSDVMMPGMTGPEAVRRLRERVPGLKVLFMSGYATADVFRAGADVEGGFLEKPFTVSRLLRRVRDVLDEP